MTDFAPMPRHDAQVRPTVITDLLVAGAAVLGFVSGFLPWLQQGGSDLKGFEWFGLFYIGLALVIGLLTVLRMGSHAKRRSDLLGFAIINLLMLIGYLSVFDSGGGEVSHGAGLWLLLAAVIVQVVALLVGALVESGRVTIGSVAASHRPPHPGPIPSGAPEYPTYPASYPHPGPPPQPGSPYQRPDYGPGDSGYQSGGPR